MDINIERERLQKRFFELYVEHYEMTGSPTITADLNDEPDFFDVSPNNVARLLSLSRRGMT